MKKLLNVLVMAVASIGLTFTGCKVDDGGSTPIFLPIGGSGGSSSAVVSPEIDYDNSYLPSDGVIYTQDAKSPPLMVSLLNEDKAEWIYKWYKNGSVIEGAESFAYYPDTSAVGVEYFYQVEVINSKQESAKVKSRKVKVNVQKAANPLETNAAAVKIKSVENEGETYTAGETGKTFKVNYEVLNVDKNNLEGTVKIEWLDNNGNTVGTGDEYTPEIPSSVEGVQIIEYKVRVTNDCTATATGDSKSKYVESSIKITVKSASITKDDIYAAAIVIPENGITGKMEYVAGETATPLTATSTVTEDTNAKKGNVTYKWYYKKDASEPDEEGESFTPDLSKYNSISSNTTVTIYVEAENDCTATATTTPKVQTSGMKEIQITVKPAATTPNIEAGQPQDGNYNVGDSAAALKVEATANGTLSYQWFKNSEKSYSGATRISGATEKTYVPSTSEEETTYYYCRVTNTLNGTTKSGNSGIATVTVAKVIPTPVSVTISNKTENSIVKNNTKNYKVTVKLSDGTTVSNASWTSSNASVASVDNDGNVSAHEKGASVITATYTAGGVTKEDSFTVTVTEATGGNGNSGITIDFN